MLSVWNWAVGKPVLPRRACGAACPVIWGTKEWESREEWAVGREKRYSELSRQDGAW